MEAVKNIKDIEKVKWDAFVKQHPQGTVFQTYEMCEVYWRTTHNQPIAIAAVTDGEIRGVLLALLMWNGNGIAKMFTVRSVIIGGPLVQNDDADVLKVLLRHYRKVLPISTIYSEIRPIYSMDSLASVLNDEGFIRKGHLNLILDVSKDQQVLWGGMHKERQRNVKHAEKNGLEYKEVVDKESIDGIVDVIKRTYKRKRVPMADFDLFLNAREALGEYIEFFAAFYEGKIIAGQIRLCYKDLVYAWFAGSDENHFKLRPNDFLMWNVICWAHDKGYKSFDFGGGGEPGKPYGVRDYKLKYGCQMFDYGRYLYYHRPLMYKIGEIGAKILIKR